MIFYCFKSQLVLFFTIFQRKKRSRMTSGKPVLNQHLLHSLIQFQKTHAVRDRRTVLRYALCHVLLTQPKLLNQHLVGFRLLNWI